MRCSTISEVARVSYLVTSIGTPFSYALDTTWLAGYIPPVRIRQEVSVDKAANCISERSPPVMMALRRCRRMYFRAVAMVMAPMNTPSTTRSMWPSPTRTLAESASATSFTVK